MLSGFSYRIFPLDPIHPYILFLSIIVLVHISPSSDTMPILLAAAWLPSGQGSDYLEKRNGMLLGRLRVKSYLKQKLSYYMVPFKTLAWSRVLTYCSSNGQKQGVPQEQSCAYGVGKVSFPWARYTQCCSR